MTGQLGTCVSILYFKHWMAPEVMENKNYSLKADVYSFGIMIWEICTRKTPYEGKNQQEIALGLINKKIRPDKSLIPRDTPAGLVDLMEFCWHEDPTVRPNFEQILKFLKKILDGNIRMNSQ